MRPESLPQIVTPQTPHLQLSPAAFHLWAGQFLEASRHIPPSDSFSPVSFLLLCRAIELELKARHLLLSEDLESIKSKFKHKLSKAYSSLPNSQRILDSDERQILQQASTAYVKKYFEYWHPKASLKPHSIVPDLGRLQSVAEKLVAQGTGIAQLR